MSHPAPSPAFATVAPTELDAVTGGASSRAATDERLMDKLQRITVAVKDAADQQAAAKANDPMSQMMPLIAMNMMRKRQA